MRTAIRAAAAVKRAGGLRFKAAAAAAPVPFSVPECETVLTGLRAATKGQRTALAQADDVKAFFWQQDPTSLEELVQFYEEMMYPIHRVRDSIYDNWVERCGFFSLLKQSKNMTEAQKAEWEAKHAELGEVITALQAEQAAYVAATFDTKIYNHVLRTLSGHLSEPGVHTTAVKVWEEEEPTKNRHIHGIRYTQTHHTTTQVFHDMTDNDVAFDDETKNLLKFTCFGDGEFENSDLLFSLIEYPERGAHTFAKGESLETISNKVLETVADRHALPIAHADEINRDEYGLFFFSFVFGRMHILFFFFCIGF